MIVSSSDLLRLLKSFNLIVLRCRCFPYLESVHFLVILEFSPMGKTIQVSGFPFLEANEVKEFLERITGQGNVIALEVIKPSKRTRRGYARVQFVNSTRAQKIPSLARKGLCYSTSYLKAWEMDMDLVPNPITDVHEMEDVTLNFGCKISREKLSVLWKGTKVSVKFEPGMKKIYFYLCFDLVKYMLQLSYENIWQMVLYCPRGQTAKLLLIQLSGAPRIYKKLNESHHCYSIDTSDDQWARTTDFTSSCIGQSSGLCLQLPFDMWLFSTVRKVKLHSIWKLVGCLPDPKVDPEFYRLVNPNRIDVGCIEHALDKLYYLEECCYDPVTWLLEQYEKYRKLKEKPKSRALILGDGLVYVHRVQVTPTASCCRRTTIYDRILSTLREGIRIGNKKFDFLAFSSSQLRDNSVWMFASTTNHTADDIRRWMGDFHSIRNVAKYAARLGQSFGSSTETLSVGRHEIEKM